MGPAGRGDVKEGGLELVKSESESDIGKQGAGRLSERSRYSLSVVAERLSRREH